MKIIPIIFFFIILFSQQAWSNNVQIGSVNLTGQNTTDDFTMVEFDITWENSWRYSNGPGNWDAAWIFVKYKIGAGPWLHTWLNNTGHQSCASTIVENGLLTPGAAFHSTSNPSLGVFLYRSSAGNGTFSCQDVQLRWNYGVNGVADNAQIDIKVFAIEMVYVPQGSFFVGSGGTELGAFYTYPNTTSPYVISSEAQITVGTQAGNLYYSFSSASGDQAGPIPAAYPKGFTAFYAMKYEISQLGYTDFLNTLSRQQQSSRVRANLMNQEMSVRFVMCNHVNPINRSAISCPPIIPPIPGPVHFFCDLNNNTIPNESNDGQYLGCHFLRYADMAAYLDWAALRLMTEFEFEKCGRGSLAPIANEFAWGDNIYYQSTALLNSGAATEIPSDDLSNNAGPIISGPVRTGAFARSTSNRTLAGAGYYGCLEISSNVRERGASIGNPAGRNYTGVHGNGILDPQGFGDVFAWPSPITASGAFFRGGNMLDDYDEIQLSYRGIAAWDAPTESFVSGGRGVRTAQ